MIRTDWTSLPLWGKISVLLHDWKDIMTSSLSRRQVAKGASWAIPAVTVAAAAPAMAASPQCVPTPWGGFGTTFDYGQIKQSIFDPSETNQLLGLSGLGGVTGLPPGATVTEFFFDFCIQQRPTDATGPGIPPLTASSLPGGGPSYTYTPQLNSGWTGVITQTAKGSPLKYPTSGVTYTSWIARVAWSAERDKKRMYRNTADGCREFATGEFGTLDNGVDANGKPRKNYVLVPYNKVTALTSRDVREGKERTRVFITVSAKVAFANGVTQTFSKSAYEAGM